MLRGLITCGRTGRVCPCEDQLRRKYYSWVVCYTKTGQRRYIPEQDALSAIETVLNRIKVPDSLINPSAGNRKTETGTGEIEGKIG